MKLSFAVLLLLFIKRSCSAMVSSEDSVEDHRLLDLPSSRTKSIESMAAEQEHDKNSMIAINVQDDIDLYEDFYDELDVSVQPQDSMNIIYFGPPISFMRIDPESILHLLIYSKTHLIPISRILLAWDIITDGKTAARLTGREYVALGSLLNVVPEEDLYYVNFGDPSVLSYFARHVVNLKSRKFGILVASYRRYFGNLWHSNATRVNDLGYLICGFPSDDLAKIRPEVFKSISVEIFDKLWRCSPEQCETLYNIAIDDDAYGKPYKWSSHEISRLSILFTYIPEQEISAIQVEAITAITPTVMRSMKQNKLKYFTKQQILRMNSKTSRIFIIRMQLRSSFDMDQLSKKNAKSAKMVFIGRIPHDCFEDTLVPLFRQAGELFEFRLMINFSGWNRGYAFAMYTTDAEANNAIRLFNNYMIRPSWQLGVCPSINNCRIFISRIPPTTPSAEIVRLLYALTEEVQEVRIRRSIASCAAIVEYKSHRGAAMARKALVAAAAAAWGCGARPAVDWSLPQSPQLLKQYREVGRWTPERGVELTRAPEEAGSPPPAPSYTLEPWSQARRLRMIHEAQRQAAAAAAEWSGRLNGNGMESLVSSMAGLSAGGCGLGAAERGVWAPPGAAPAPRLAPGQRDFNPWTARHPLQEFISPAKAEQ